jgi:6-phosphogluconolactonase (cycloisomerase 2 family)
MAAQPTSPSLGMPATFLFATLDGAIIGWNANVGIASGASAPSVNAVIAVKTTDGSSFTGLTSAVVDGNRYLYAANFNNGRVDVYVYDSNFHPVTLNPNDQDQNNGNRDQNNNDNGDNNRAFTDRFLPRNFVPFNVQSVGNDIVVTYALHSRVSLAKPTAQALAMSTSSPPRGVLSSASSMAIGSTLPGE